MSVSTTKGEREDSPIRWPLAIIIHLTFDVIQELFDTGAARR